MIKVLVSSSAGCKNCQSKLSLKYHLCKENCWIQC